MESYQEVIASYPLLSYIQDNYENIHDVDHALSTAS